MPRNHDTQVDTKIFGEGHDRVFGERKKQPAPRVRYRFQDGKFVEFDRPTPGLDEPQKS